MLDLADPFCQDTRFDPHRSGFMGLMILKNPLAGIAEVRGFSRPKEGHFFLMKIYGVLHPNGSSFLVLDLADPFCVARFFFKRKCC